MTAAGGIIHEEYHSPALRRERWAVPRDAALGESAGEGQDGAQWLSGHPERATSLSSRFPAAQARPASSPASIAG